MKAVAVIPARYASTRLPRKPYLHLKITELFYPVWTLFELIHRRGVTSEKPPVSSDIILKNKNGGGMFRELEDVVLPIQRQRRFQ